MEGKTKQILNRKVWNKARFSFRAFGPRLLIKMTTSVASAIKAKRTGIIHISVLSPRALICSWKGTRTCMQSHKFLKNRPDMRILRKTRQRLRAKEALSFPAAKRVILKCGGKSKKQKRFLSLHTTPTSVCAHEKIQRFVFLRNAAYTNAILFLCNLGISFF